MNKTKKKQWKQLVGTFIALVSLVLGYFYTQDGEPVKKVGKQGENQDVVATVVVPADKYPETALHIKEAIQEGHTDICTIDRKGASERRKQSLAGIKTVKGKDRDEYPMAFCAEGGKGAHVKLIDPADNRGAGSYVGNQVGKYEDGTKVRVIAK